MIIVVGSTNSVKVDATAELLKEYPTFADAKIVAVSASSDVSDQPFTLEETIQGAKNRAKNAFNDCQLSIGIEGGLLQAPGTRTGYLHITACSIFDGRHHYIGISAGFEVPDQILELMHHQKLDMSQACLHSGITSNAKLGAAEGLIGILSQGRIDRKEYTKQGLRMALVQLENSAWFSPKQDA
jgi:inosine/xanthosine triphosphatase